MSGDSDSHETKMERDSGRRTLSNIVDLSMRCRLYRRETVIIHIHKDTPEKNEGRPECEYSRQAMSQQQHLHQTHKTRSQGTHVSEHISYS